MAVGPGLRAADSASSAPMSSEAIAMLRGSETNSPSAGLRRLTDSISSSRSRSSNSGRFSATTPRSEEHTSELQSLMRISYAVFCLKKKNKKHTYELLKHTSRQLQT